MAENKIKSGRQENGKPTERIQSLRLKTISAERYLSLEQARIITRIYRENGNLPVIKKRALALAESLVSIPIMIDPEELIVGNRTPGIRQGVVFPEAGISWLSGEIKTIHKREQDSFLVHPEDITVFFGELEPFWKGRTMEDKIYALYGEELKAISTVVKINQRDHAQGHICPDTGKWLSTGPAGLLAEVRERMEGAEEEKRVFYESVERVLSASIKFIERYSFHAGLMAKDRINEAYYDNLITIAGICDKLSKEPPSTFREAVQSLWFLFVILQMESNASSFSPGRADQYLYPFYLADLNEGRCTRDEIVEILDALFIKFNQIVYMRNSQSARYFAGFPTGFNITIGGIDNCGRDSTNELSYLFLEAQDHIRLPQPNLTARIHQDSPEEFISECSRVIGLGTGMPQIVNDRSVIPALLKAGVEYRHASDYVLVGCVEITTQGNFLGWSDAAMFNLVKVLELTLNNGKCLLTGDIIGLQSGSLADYGSYEELEDAFREQIDYFIGKMVKACEVVESHHQMHLPSPFLSSVISECLLKGLDVTRGGATYNYSGIQAIQVANIADSLSVIKKLVYLDKTVSGDKMLNALRSNFEGDEVLRQRCVNKVPKYGNDVEWVDNLGAEWIRFFYERLQKYRNYRGGAYHTGLYTVSAHVPMGQNVGATPDGRLAKTPLADGGVSPMYGRDMNGPTAVLKSVSRLPSLLAPNGTLLNLKFLPSVFSNRAMKNKFVSFVRGFSDLPIHHVQFNVITADELIRAKADPESYRGLTIRVAGYTAFFTDLAPDLQDEIIARTTHGEES